MVCKFSFFLNFIDAFKENDIGIFHADDGDVCRVTYKSNVCRDLLLKIEWTLPKQILVTAKLYNTSYKRCFSSKGMIVNGRKSFMKMRGAFNVSNSRNYKVLCVISLIPYIQFNDCIGTASESIEDSGFLGSEFQQSAMDENNIIYDDAKCGAENMEENIDDKNTVKVNEISVLDKQDISRPVEESEHQPGKSEFQSDESTLINCFMMAESVMTASKDISLEKMSNEMSLLMNKGNLSPYGLCGEAIENASKSLESNGFCYSRQLMKNEENNLEKNSVENRKHSLIINSDNQSDEFVSSIDTSNSINCAPKSKQEDVILITKILTLDDYSEEIIEDINTINNSKNLESNSLPLAKLPMVVHQTEISSDNHSVLCNEENILGSSDLKGNKEISSSNIVSEIKWSEETEFLSLHDKKNKSCLRDTVKPVMKSENMEVSILLESNDDSMQNNQSEEKDIKRLSNSNICVYDGLDSSKIKKPNVDSLIKESKPPTINANNISGVLEDSEITNTILDGHKSKSQQIPSSKTGLVFQTLVSKLCVADSDREVRNLKEVASSSDMKYSLENESDSTRIFPIMESELKGLSMDMLDLLTTGDMADASITNGEKDIKVHRAIISCRSPALKKLFTQHKQDEVRYCAVVDIPSYILEDVIIFLYVGLVYIKNSKMAQDLYKVAERYGIDDLTDICSKHISK